MSTLQVANLWFEATGNNRIQYDSGANGFNFIAAGSNVATINTTGFTWTGNTIVSTTTLNVGNTNINATAFTVGNSTVNTTVTSTSFAVANSTVSSTLNNNTILLGNSTVNTSINTSAVFLGNSSANVVISPSSANTMTINDLTVGYLELPQNSQSTSYTAVLADSGKHILHPSSDNNARTFTIPANASVPYPVGTALTFVNAANTLTIAITSDTMYLSGDTGTTGSRTLGSYGMATALKIASTTWIISGSNLT